MNASLHDRIVLQLTGESYRSVRGLAQDLGANEEEVEAVLSDDPIRFRKSPVSLGGVQLYRLGQAQHGLRDLPFRNTHLSKLTHYSTCFCERDFLDNREAINPLTVNRLYGRDHELTDISERFRHSRLVSVVGLPGVGKSRLLQEHSAKLSDAGEAVQWVQTARFHSYQMIREQLRQLYENYVRFSTLLESRGGENVTSTLFIVFDNCDAAHNHLKRALPEALAQFPKMRVLVGSRVALNAPYESILRVRELAARDRKTWLGRHLSTRDAAYQLLRDSIAHRESNSLSGWQKFQIHKVCEVLGGNPRALEAAAVICCGLYDRPWSRLVQDLLWYNASNTVFAELRDDYDRLFNTLSENAKKTLLTIHKLDRRNVCAKEVKERSMDLQRPEVGSALKELYEKCMLEVDFRPEARYKLPRLLKSYLTALKERSDWQGEAVRVFIKNYMIEEDVDFADESFVQDKELTDNPTPT